MTEVNIMKQLLFLIILMTAITGCTADKMKEGAQYFAQSETEIKRSHLPTVTVDGQNVYVMRGEIRPEQISGNTKPNPVPAGGVVEIQWKYVPENPAIRIQEWHGGHHTWKKIKSNSFKLPQEKGLYLYNIHLDWGKYDDVTGSYSLFFEVQ
jgi:hypothetical protein